MTRRIKILIIAFFIVLSMDFLEVLAMSEPNNILEPDVVIPPCDPDLGCYLETTIESFYIHNPARYLQNYDPWGPHFMSSTLTKYLPNTFCPYTIAAAGCGVASEAVIAQEFTGTTITPDDINNTVVNACSFTPTKFEAAYSSVDYIGSVDISWSTTIKTYKDIAIKFVEDINNGYLLIIRSNYTAATDSSGHYEVAYGYKKTTEHYANMDIVYYDLLMIDSALSNHQLLSAFINKFPQPKTVFRFKDKTP